MSFFKKTVLGLSLAVTFASTATANDGPLLNDQDRALIERSRLILEQSAKMNAPEWLRMYDPEAPVQQTDDGVKKWIPAAQEISDNTNDFVRKAIKSAYDVTNGAQIRTIGSDIREDSPLVPGEELYYFVSFSQPESELKEILQAASDADARVILRGMRPGDRMVNHTARAMFMLGKDIKPLPKVAMDPRLHKVFGVTEAPSMVYRKGDEFVKVKGVATTNWFLTKAREAQGTKDLGSVSTTYEIAERDVVEEIQSRVAAVDWDAKRRKAMNRYISKLPDFKLPTAVKDSIYKIDPRVQFQKNITADDGTLLAAKGQVVNPIDHFPGQSLTLYIFDGMSEPQKALVKEMMKTARGQIGLMTSRIDKEQGFQHISDMSKDYGQQVYFLQQRMINRFQLKFLPAEVHLGNGQIVVREFGIRAQEVAYFREREAKFKSDGDTDTSKSPVITVSQTKE